MAGGLPSLKQGLPYLAVCLELIPCLAAALALFFKVHLGNGEIFLREKKAKQQLSDLRSENSDTIPSPLPATFISHVMLFAANLLWGKKKKGIFLLEGVFEAKGKAIVLLCLGHMELGRPHSSTGQGHMVPAWDVCWAMGLGHALCLCLSPAHTHSSHTRHCGVTDLARVRLFTSHTPRGSCRPRTGHRESIWMGKRKC